MAVQALHGYLLVRIIEGAHLSRIPKWCTLVISLERQARYFFNVREDFG